MVNGPRPGGLIHSDDLFGAGDLTHAAQDALFQNDFNGLMFLFHDGITSLMERDQGRRCSWSLPGSTGRDLMLNEYRQDLIIMIAILSDGRNDQILNPKTELLNPDQERGRLGFVKSDLSRISDHSRTNFPWRYSRMTKMTLVSSPG